MKQNQDNLIENRDLTTSAEDEYLILQLTHSAYK